ncbi:uncharacterized protein LOC105631100 [Jatropha curcas]|uniref:uncharacterized protein LOC105631100 n=1 Tax=Jatropha curcas TaxID=180498 RepID=UPI0018931054|nr:uncharacterized protein LOC105631100 [Jatropha curcas]
MNQGRRNYPYSNSYDNRLRNHPNLSYGNPNNTLNAPPGFIPPEKKPHDDLLTALSKSHMDFMNETRENNKIQQAAIRNLEIQLVQFANMMAAGPQGTLPSNTEKNPKEQVQAITLRSGKQLEGTTRIEKEKEEQRKVPTIDLEEKEEVKPYVPSIPFPQRLKKCKTIRVSSTLAQMPSYAKFLKEILIKKRKINDQGMVMFTEECSAIIQNKLPPKPNDPGSFSIPCNIGNLNFEKALANLGASINLMSYEVFKILEMGELKPTRMSLQLADRSIKYLKGIVEDMLVKGRILNPWKTLSCNARALIDVHEGKLTLRVGHEDIVFDVLKSCKLPKDNDDYFRIDVVDECVKDNLHKKDNNNINQNIIDEVKPQGKN